MTTVAVDIEDLEKLVLTSGAMKSIEAALNTRKNDPFVQPHLEFTAAHNRLASVVRNAKRGEAGTLVNWDEPLTQKELRALQELKNYFDANQTLFIKAKDRIPKAGEALASLDAIAAKGCCVIGQVGTAIVWAGESAPELKLDPTRFAVKITRRGMEKLASAGARTG